MSEAVQWRSRVELRPFNSFGVSEQADRFALCRSEDALVEALRQCQHDPLPPQLIAGGTNLLLVGAPRMALIQPALSGIEFASPAGGCVRVRAAAGERWDDLVRACCARGLWGIENLALIPGHVGAAPVQNIGAYGVELGECLVAVEAIDRHSLRRERLPVESLALGYRDSLFKHEPGRWVILRVELELHLQGSARLDYAGLRGELTESAPSPSTVAEAVSRVRRSKLPDPSRIGNAGSFFKNPVVSTETGAALRRDHPGMPCFELPEAAGCKLSAAWLIERAGFKGLRHGDAGIFEGHALVLVNHGNASGAELLAVAREVARGVEQRFGVALEPEPVIVGADFREPA
jgi:UDP-N-acetylmuramate dehydrogenase